MNIAIDARLINETGVGRYIRNLISQLAVFDTENRYIVFLLPHDLPKFVLPNSRWEKRPLDVHWHTFKEQIVMPWIFWKAHVDLVHIPYFTAPIFYPGKFVVTIHDLTILHIHTGKASTLPYWKYFVRKIGYRIILAISMLRAKQILAVSHAVKKDILDHFWVNEKKISVTYEGIDDSFLTTSNESIKKRPLTEPYFLYVGNVYPHKNVEVLLQAFAQIRSKIDTRVKLVFVGPDDYFYERLALLVTSLEMDDSVEFRHGISDQELGQLYAHSIALVFPSRMEGFGLPALEAILYNCPVIASDIPIFREILKGFARFVDSTKSENLSRAMNELLQNGPQDLKSQSERLAFLSQYSWQIMAKKTRHIYTSCK